MEVVIVRDFVSTTIVEFIWVHIIYRFGIPDTITIDKVIFLKAQLYKLYAKYQNKAIPMVLCTGKWTMCWHSLKPSAAY